MAQAVGRQPLTVEVLVRPRSDQRGIFGRQIGTGTCSPLRVIRVFPSQFHSTNAPHSFFRLNPTTYSTTSSCDTLKGTAFDGSTERR